MLLIIIRARCNVPIVIMGETGCGKTSLVRFLAAEIMQEGFEVINFHAGIKELHIIEKMLEIIQRAEILKITENKIWVFLDEINTCDCLGIITELICHKTMRGTKIPDNIIFIAACNPYRIRRNTNEVGLIKQRIATRLVYTVHPLPDALMDYVWDYGSLTENEERLYIGNILSQISGIIKKISIDLVCELQIFIRKCEDKYSVSLRDVARFKILHEWFHTTLTHKNEENYIIINHKTMAMEQSVSNILVSS
jgi:tRNA 2-selenouridine synthase SelU